MAPKPLKAVAPMYAYKDTHKQPNRPRTSRIWQVILESRAWQWQIGKGIFTQPECYKWRPSNHSGSLATTYTYQLRAKTTLPTRRPDRVWPFGPSAMGVSRAQAYAKQSYRKSHKKLHTYAWRNAMYKGAACQQAYILAMRKQSKVNPSIAQDLAHEFCSLALPRPPHD